MGAIAVSMELRLEEGAGRLPHVPVLILVDRRADVFLARRSQAEGWVVKPLDPMRLSRAVRTVLAGGRYEDEAYRPTTVPAGR
jgi:DNA-binding NarL/FixJ family response regulator